MLLYSFINRNLVKAPHRLMPPVVFVALLLMFFYNPHSAFYTFSLSDPDDYMRLNETINWLQWAGWYDLSHPRLSPGAHTVIHWSRLLDMPLALMMWPFLKDWGYRSSAMLASFIEPLLLLGLLLALVPAMARPLVGRANARLAALFVPFAPTMLFNFTPGRVDHHNWNILIAGVGLMALPRMLLCRGGWKAGIFSGIGFALALWISPEIMPCLILTLGCLAWFSAMRGGFTLRNAAVFGSALAVATAAILPAALPVSQWQDRTVSWFSTGYVIFSALIGAAFVASWLLGRQTENKILRLALIMALGGFAAMIFLALVPEAIHGPFAGYDDFDSTIALDNINEAQPLTQRALHIDPNNSLTIARAILSFLRYVFPPLMCLIVCVYAALTKSRRARMVWIVYGVCLGATLALAVFSQRRLLWFTEIFQVAPLVYLAWNMWSSFRVRRTFWQRNWATILAFMILGPFPVLAAPRISAMVVGSTKSSACFLKPAAEYIAGPWGYTNRPYVILAGANEGPELLFRTPHSVIGANFDVPANQDVFDFFSARDSVTAIDILRKWHVDLVLTCRRIPPLYAGMDNPRIGKNAFLKPDDHGGLHLVSSLTSPSLVEMLVNGHPPDWLKPVEIPGSKDYLLFEVNLPEIKK